MQVEHNRDYGIRAELLASAIADLETIATRQNSSQLHAIAANMRKGKVIEALPVFKSVADTYGAAPGLPLDMKLTAWLDYAAVALHGERDKAIETLEQVLASQPDHPASLALLAHIRLEDHDFDAAEPLLARLSPLADAAESRKWKALGCEYSGIIHHAAGRLDAAGSCYKEAIEHFRALGDAPRLAEALGNCGLIHRRAKDFTVAEELFTEALDIWRDQGFDEETARTLGYLASIYFATNEHDKAIRLFTERAEVNARLRDTAELAADHANIGLATARKGDIAGACQHWREAQAIYRSLDRLKEADAVGILLRKNGCTAANAA